MIYLLTDFGEIVKHEDTTTIDSTIKYFESAFISLTSGLFNDLERYVPCDGHRLVYN